MCFGVFFVIIQNLLKSLNQKINKNKSKAHLIENNLLIKLYITFFLLIPSPKSI